MFKYQKKTLSAKFVSEAYIVIKLSKDKDDYFTCWFVYLMSYDNIKLQNVFKIYVYFVFIYDTTH